MKTLLKVFILVTVFYFATGNGDFVTKDELNELKQIVGSLQKLYMNEITKNNLLRKKCNDLEGKLNYVIAELKFTQSKLSTFEHKMKLSDFYNQTKTKIEQVKNASIKKYEQEVIRIKEPNKTDRQNVTFKSQIKTVIKEEENNSFDRLIKRLDHISGVPKRVAFSAWNATDYTNLGYHQTIVFNNVAINEGNCYHQTTGVFSSHISGVYFFYFSIIVAPNVELRTALVKDGTEISFSYAYGASSKLSQAGNMALVHLNVGDNVWVRIRASKPPTGDDIGSDENSFSGFLLFSDNNS